MLPLKRVRLSPEEFVLLRAIILSLYGLKFELPSTLFHAFFDILGQNIFYKI
jgi:hypothetical protein